MNMKAAQKMIDALNQLMEGYVELQEAVRDDIGAPTVETEEGGEDPEMGQELEAAISTEVRAVVESLFEHDEYTSEEFATVISALTQALEEIDPDVFIEEGELEDEEDDIEYEDDDETYDYDEDEDLEELDDDEEDD